LVLAGLAMAGLAVHPGRVALPAPGGASLFIPNPLGADHLGPVPGTLLIGTFPGLFVALAGFLAAALVSLAVRYRAGDQLLRQQVKWLALTAMAIVISLLAALLGVAAGQSWLTTVAYTPLALSAMLGIPAAMTIAILRHRLYDIDRIISRTLAYAIVTGLLVGVYAGLVLLATRVLSFHSAVAVAAATLAAAALFNPLRRRVQRFVDRRFNRARYDAQATVAVFAAQLKDTVDLDSLRDDLASVVQKALEPAHISVWVSPRN
jgi:drug/metabolite transporter (DMT)-like permease